MMRISGCANCGHVRIASENLDWQSVDRLPDET